MGRVKIETPPVCSRCLKEAKLVAIQGPYQLCPSCQNRWLAAREKELQKLLAMFVRKDWPKGGM